MNHISDTTDIGITFQMTLDAFLDETHIRIRIVLH